MRAFTHATVLSPRAARLYVLLGHAHELTRAYEAAEEAYRRAVALAPERAYPSRVLGARLLTDDVLRRWPRFAPGHVGRALLLTQLGRNDAAQRSLEAAVRLDPQNADYHARLARLREPRLREPAR